MTATTLETTTGYALIDTVVETPHDPFANGGDYVDFYVTGYAEGAPDTRRPAELIGTIQKARRTSYEDNPLISQEVVNDLGRTYFTGALVNPTPENGKFYRSLVPAVGHPHGMLYRFNDIDHVGDRNIQTQPYSIVAGPAGTAWPIPDDGTDELPAPYIEVQAPEAELSGDRQEAEPEIVTGDATLAFGKAVPRDEDGRIVLNPEPVPGKNYAIWFVSDTDDSYRTVYHGTVLDKGDDDRFHISLDGRWAGNTETHSYQTETSVFVMNETVNWAELVMVEPEKTGTDEARIALYRELADLQSKFEEFNEALNEKADERGWCPEYEDVLERLDGMEGRSEEKRRRDWDVYVNVTFSGEVDSPSSRVDSAVDESVFDSDVSNFQMSSMTYNATARVRVRVESQPDDSDEIADAITDTMVSDAIDNAGGYGIEVDEWNVDHYESAD
jgi:hypothetical protein